MEEVSPFHVAESSDGEFLVETNSFGVFLGNQAFLNGVEETEENHTNWVHDRKSGRVHKAGPELHEDGGFNVLSE
jgi:hypothetical protein